MSDPQTLAETVAQKMYQRDQASQSLGMKILEMRPGYARVNMSIREDMLNGHDIAHGGLIFSLADSAFAFACNSYNHNTLAAGCVIDYLAPAKAGDILTAEAAEQSLSGRTGVYDVTITNQTGQRVALFRGRAYRVSGQII